MYIRDIGSFGKVGDADGSTAVPVVHRPNGLVELRAAVLVDADGVDPAESYAVVLRRGLAELDDLHVSPRIVLARGPVAEGDVPRSIAHPSMG